MKETNMTTSEIINRKNFEDKMLIVFIFIGLLLGSILYFQSNGRPISSIFLSFALSCLLYRFLGGIAQETKFHVGMFKLGGSAAFMIGCIFFINEYIFPEMQKQAIILKSPDDKWYPVRISDGVNDSVIVLNQMGDTIHYKLNKTDHEILKQRGYNISSYKNNYYLHSIIDSTVCGYVTFDNVYQCIKNKLDFTIENFRVFTLYSFPDSTDEIKKYKSTIEIATINNTFPFYVELENTDMNIKSNNDSLIITDVPRSEKSYLINIDKTYYIVVVLHANFEIVLNKWYSEFLIGKVNLDN